MIHDASDIGVDMLKLVNYCKLRGKKGWFGSEVCTRGWDTVYPCFSTWSLRCPIPTLNLSIPAVLWQIAFALNLISWLYFRTYVYPVYVLYSAMIQSSGMVSGMQGFGRGVKSSQCFNGNARPHSRPCALLLCPPPPS